MSSSSFQFSRIGAAVLLVGLLAANSGAFAMDQPDAANPQQKQTAAQRAAGVPAVAPSGTAAAGKPASDTQRGGRDG
jgi:hypothetical protein